MCGLLFTLQGCYPALRDWFDRRSLVLMCVGFILGAVQVRVPFSCTFAVLHWRTRVSSLFAQTRPTSTLRNVWSQQRCVLFILLVDTWIMGHRYLVGISYIYLLAKFLCTKWILVGKLLQMFFFCVCVQCPRGPLPFPLLPSGNFYPPSMCSVPTDPGILEATGSVVWIKVGCKILCVLCRLWGLSSPCVSARRWKPKPSAGRAESAPRDSPRFSEIHRDSPRFSPSLLHQNRTETRNKHGIRIWVKLWSLFFEQKACSSLGESKEQSVCDLF